MSKNLSGLDFKKYSIQKVDIVFAGLYLFLQAIGLTGNVLVITVVRKTPSMYTTTNLLLVNLAIADILTLLTCPRNGYVLPITLNHPTGEWGDLLCKFLTGNAIVGVTMTVSSVTLTVLALERYRALLRPLYRRFVLRLDNVRYIIAGIWVISLSVNIPDFIENQYSEKFLKCVCPFSLEMVKDSTIHVACTVLFVGVVPFLVLAYCYSQILSGIFLTKRIFSRTIDDHDLENKKRLARLLLSVTAAFYVCYIPYGAFFVYLIIQEKNFIITYYESHHSLLKFFEFLLVCSCTLNPILYAFQSSNYRHGFRKACCCCGGLSANKVRRTSFPLTTRKNGCGDSRANVISLREQTMKLENDNGNRKVKVEKNVDFSNINNESIKVN